MKTVLAVIGAVTLLFVLALFAVCNDDDNESLNGTAVSFQASHERERCYEDCGDWSGGSDGNSGGEYGGGEGGDTDQRGDHNCRNFCFYGVPYPGQPPTAYPNGM